MEKRGVVWHDHHVSKEERAQLKRQKPCIIWFTGLSGSGKSTIAGLVEKHLAEEGKHTYLLDGDNVRHGLCGDLGFSDADRVENIRRIGEMCKLFVDAGEIVLSAFISPFVKERTFIRHLVEPGEFIEVFVDTPLELCEIRDPKGLYQKAREGKIKNFTGIDSPYERPESPEVHLQTKELSVEICVKEVLNFLKERKMLDA